MNNSKVNKRVCVAFLVGLLVVPTVWTPNVYSVSPGAKIAAGGTAAVVGTLLGAYFHGLAHKDSEQLEMLKLLKSHILENEFRNSSHVDPKLAEFIFELERLELWDTSQHKDLRSVSALADLDAKIANFTSAWRWYAAIEALCFSGAGIGVFFAGKGVLEKWSAKPTPIQPVTLVQRPPVPRPQSNTVKAVVLVGQPLQRAPKEVSDYLEWERNLEESQLLGRRLLFARPGLVIEDVTDQEDASKKRVGGRSQEQWEKMFSGESLLAIADKPHNNAPHNAPQKGAHGREDSAILRISKVLNDDRRFSRDVRGYFAAEKKKIDQERKKKEAKLIQKNQRFMNELAQDLETMKSRKAEEDERLRKECLRKEQEKAKKIEEEKRVSKARQAKKQKACKRKVKARRKKKDTLEKQNDEFLEKIDIDAERKKAEDQRLEAQRLTKLAKNDPEEFKKVLDEYERKNPVEEPEKNIHPKSEQ